MASTRDVSLCVKDQTNLAERKKTERKGELLDKLAKLSDSEPLDIFLTSEFLLKSKVHRHFNVDCSLSGWVGGGGSFLEVIKHFLSKAE